MISRINQWAGKYLASDEAIGLLVIIFSSVLLLWLLGGELAPVLGALIIAFILQGAVNVLSKRLPESLSIYLVYISFLAFSALVIVMLLPVAWRQLVSLLNHQLPLVLTEARALVLMLPEKYPDMVSHEQAVTMVEYASERLAAAGQGILSFSISKIPNLMAVLVYTILVSFVGFFLFEG